MRTPTAIPTGLITRLDARTLVIESMAHADLDDRKARWFLFLDQQGDHDVYDEQEVRAWIGDASRPGAAQSTQITLDDARELVKTYLTSDEERAQAWDEFIETFGVHETYDADAVREWTDAVDVDAEPPVLELPQIDHDWQISFGRNRMTRRYYADLSYLEPVSNPERRARPWVAQHVARVRGFRTAFEAIYAAAEVAQAEDERFERQGS